LEIQTLNGIFRYSKKPELSGCREAAAGPIFYLVRAAASMEIKLSPPSRKRLRAP
jgi:hypothetical protein